MTRWQRTTVSHWLAGLALIVGGLSLAGCRPDAALGAEPTATATTLAAPTAEPTATPPPATATRAILAPTAAPSATSSPVPTATSTLPPTDTVVPTLTNTPVTWPTPDAETGNRRVRLPILMYHYVEPWPAEADEIRQGLTVWPEDFAAQMAYLHERGYVAVSLYDLMEALTLGRPLPERAVVLTFDDGYRSVAEYAAPAMAPYGYTGTVFVITQLMDEERPEYLTWAQAEALYAAGWKIEPHTKTHEMLAGRERDFQLYQMLGSLQTVEAHIGARPRFFAYPSGKYDDLSVTLAAEMDLWGAVTVGAGRYHAWADRYTLRRLRVSGLGALQDFIFALEGDQLLTPTAPSPRTP